MNMRQKTVVIACRLDYTSAAVDIFAQFHFTSLNFYLDYEARFSIVTLLKSHLSP